jgi:hypothetical protein
VEPKAKKPTAATGTTGTDVNVSNGTITTSGTITLNIPDASATARGLITTGTQTIAGAKTFSEEITSTNFVLSGGTGNTGLYFGHTDKVVLANYVVGGGIDFETNGGAINMVLDASANLSVVGNITGASIIKSGGTSSQFLKADGSVDSTSYGTGSVTSVGLSSATNGVTIGATPVTTSGTITLAIATASGSQNGLLSSIDFNTFIGKQNAITLTTTGTSGAATLVGATLNIPQYADQFVGTVTSVAALTLGTTGTDLSSTVANGTTTPVITLNVPTASATNRGALSSTDWTTFNNKQAALNGTGFVKISGTTISYDNTSYLPLTGGTLSSSSVSQTLRLVNTSTGYGLYVQSDSYFQGDAFFQSVFSSLELSVTLNLEEISSNN